MKNIAITAGGDSGEYKISLMSAKAVSDNLDKTKYNAFIIFIRNGKWIYKTDNNKDIEVDKNDFSICIDNKKIYFDCVFNAIHGTPGENGKLQGYFDLLNIPYTSCNLVTSAITFNKNFCNKIVSSLGYQTAKSILLYKDEKINIEKITSEISLPCFVKPNNGGSSICTSKVNKKEELEGAIKLAFNQDTEVLVEEFINGREITCGIIKTKTESIVLPLTEIVSKNEFFDYEAKYNEDFAEEITPAPIPEDVEIDCKCISSDLYSKLNCKGIVRFDYIYSDNALYFLEVNTIPGFSGKSIIPKQIKAYGMPIKKLYSMAIEDAILKK